MGFQHISEEERKRIARKGGLRRRSPAMAKAWQDAEKIKEMYHSGRQPGVIAKEYFINVRAVYRIIEGEMNK